MKQSTSKSGRSEARAMRECLRVLHSAAKRLEGLARRLRKNQDFLSEWTARSVAWELTMCANSSALAEAAEADGEEVDEGD
jgi:hypothetical protein